jgi:Ca2+-binding RTX toxin-like protein
LVLPTGHVAAAEPATCAGRAVTIDLNEPDAPDPWRDDSDVVLGTPDDDDITTGDGDDVVCAGPGSDLGSAGGGDDYVSGGDGDDSLYGGDGVDRIRGGAGDDEIWLRGESPTESPQTAHGGPGDDFSNSSADDEVLVGDGGTDTVSFQLRCRECGTEYPDPRVGITVDLRSRGPQDTGGRGVDELSGIENLAGTAYDDVLLGDGDKNRLDGFYGDDTLNGRRGADLLLGGPGHDRCIGGRGPDRTKGC